MNECLNCGSVTQNQNMVSTSEQRDIAILAYLGYNEKLYPKVSHSFNNAEAKVQNGWMAIAKRFLNGDVSGNDTMEGILLHNTFHEMATRIPSEFNEKTDKVKLAWWEVVYLLEDIRQRRKIKVINAEKNNACRKSKAVINAEKNNACRMYEIFKKDIHGVKPEFFEGLTSDIKNAWHLVARQALKNAPLYSDLTLEATRLYDLYRSRHACLLCCFSDLDDRLKRGWFAIVEDMKETRRIKQKWIKQYNDNTAKQIASIKKQATLRIEERLEIAAKLVFE